MSNYLKRRIGRPLITIRLAKDLRYTYREEKIMKLTKQILVFIWLKLFEVFKFILVGCWYVSFWGSVIASVFLIVYWVGFGIMKILRIPLVEEQEKYIYFIPGLFFLMLILILYQIYDSKKFKK
jgi:hypothetical protein